MKASKKGCYLWVMAFLFTLGTAQEAFAATA